MAEVIKSTEFPDSEIDGKVQVQIEIKFKHRDEDVVFVQNIYVAKDNAEAEAQEYADQYEKDYLADRKREDEEREAAEKAEDTTE